MSKHYARVRAPGRALAVAAHPRRVRRARPASRSTTARSTPRRTVRRRAGAFAADGGAAPTSPCRYKQRALALCDARSASARAAPARSTRWSATATAGTATTPTAPAWCATSPAATAWTCARAAPCCSAPAARARGVAPALLDAGIGDLFIVNRTPERADALADALGEPGRVHPRYFDDLRRARRIRPDRQRHLGRARRRSCPTLPMSLVGPPHAPRST